MTTGSISYYDLTRLSLFSLPEHKEDSFVVIDFETTGFSPDTSEIVEFGAVKVSNMEITLRLASLCRPHGFVSRGTTELTGITNQMVEPYPYFEDFLPLLLDFFGDSIIAAHNAPFDIGFLLKYINAAGLDYLPRVFCTLSASRIMFRDLKSRSLESVTAHLGIKNNAAHRALGDALATAELLIYMMKNC